MPLLKGVSLKLWRMNLGIAFARTSSCEIILRDPYVQCSGICIRRVTSTPDPNTFEKYRDTPAISIAILLQRYALFWQKVVYTPPICIAIRLPFVSRYFCRSLGSGVVGTPPTQALENEPWDYDCDDLLMRDDLARSLRAM